MQEKEVLTVKEAAEFLQIDRNRVYDMCAAPDCPFAIKWGKSIRVYKPKLKEWLEAQLNA